MPRRPDFILQISVRNIEDFSPEAVVKSPRTFRPIDVQNACKNLTITVPAGTPPLAMSLAHYIAMDFFALAHSSGLYNRQIKLWESLPKTLSIEIHQLRKGLFATDKLPEFDLVFMDYKKRPIIFAHFAKPMNSGEKYDYLKSFREFIKRASLYQGIVGAFVCYPSPFPSKVSELVRKEINAQDNVARFESILPKHNFHLNLLELESTSSFDPTLQTNLHKIRLVHPDLQKKKPAGNSMPGADLSNLDLQSDYSNES